MEILQENKNLRYCNTEVTENSLGDRAGGNQHHTEILAHPIQVFPYAKIQFVANLPSSMYGGSIGTNKASLCMAGAASTGAPLPNEKEG